MLRDWLLTFQSVTIIYMAREEAVHSGTAVETLDTFSSHFHFYATFAELLLQTNYCNFSQMIANFQPREDS